MVAFSYLQLVNMQLLRFLFIFAICYCTMALKPQRYCGKQLTIAIKVYCGPQSDLYLLRRRRGVIDDCCRSPCSIKELRKYCPRTIVRQQPTTALPPSISQQPSSALPSPTTTALSPTPIVLCCRFCHNKHEI